MKKIFSFFIILLFFFLIFPKTIFATERPPFGNKTCGFEVKAYKMGSTTPLPNPGMYEVDYAFDQLELSFNLGKIGESDPDNWKQFADVYPNPENGNPDILDDNPAEQVRMDWNTSGRCSLPGFNFAERKFSGVKTDSILSSGKIIAEVCSTFKSLGQSTIYLYTQEQGKEIPLCTGTYTLVDTKIEDKRADIKIISTNDKQDVDSYWDVTIDNVQIPPSYFNGSILPHVYLVYLKDEQIEDEHLSERKNLNNGYAPPPMTTDFTEWGFWARQMITAGSSVDTHPVSFQLKPLKKNTYIIKVKSLAIKPQAGIPPWSIEIKDIWEKSFTVVNRDEPIPTTDPGPAICTDINRMCKRGRPGPNGEPNNCQDGCNYCPGCPDYDKYVAGKVYLAPNLEQLCNQVTDKNRLKYKCLDCVTNPDPSQRGIWTAVGCLPLDVSQLLKKFVFTAGIGIAGGIAFLYFLYGSFLILTSMGNPERIEEAKQIIVSSISGLLLIIFSIALLTIIGVDILALPGFGK